MVDEEEMAAASAATAEGGEYMNTSDPSILRFLIAAREELTVYLRGVKDIRKMNSKSRSLTSSKAMHPS
eukprot:scaffold64799_cov20-Tisochrysis_lutea.AAC.1